MTESLWDEGLLVHANLGYVVGDEGDSVSSVGTLGSGHVRSLVTGGVGCQVRIVGGFHGMGEVYYGDPYDPRFSHPAAQAGFRYIFNQHVQMDGTFGSTLRPAVAADGHVQVERWGTLGLRLVSPELW